MAYQIWSQDNFSKGELSPYMYGRAQVNQYFDGLKTAQNVLTYPTGAAGKRFGTLYQATLANISSFDQIFFQTFQWLDHCLFQLVFSPLNIAVYLEGILVANVVTTLDAVSVYNLDYTVIGANFRVAGEGFKPYDLTLAKDSGNVITAGSGTSFTLTSAITAGLVVPVSFTNAGGVLPTTSPQIKAGIVYFAKNLTTSTVAIYSSAYNAKFNIDPYTITNAGTGTNTMFTWNTWTFPHSRFRDLPFYDFNSAVTSYDAIDFTVTPIVNTNYAAVNLSAPYALLTSAYVGGAFFGGGGSGRITSVIDTSTFQIAISMPFDVTAKTLRGSLCLLAEPAWSDARGWPEKCSSYQNRALFANTDSLPNGFWASVINDYSDFGDLTTDDDDAISWFPSSNDINVIRFIVPFRSITVHTNSGIYSSPLSEVAAITPSTFTLQLQDSTPADVLQPQAIDNQIIVLSGDDVHTMLWDGINNAYTSNIVSIVSEQVIRDPVDEAAFADLKRAGSRYVMIVNANGSLAVYQTLQSEQVSGFTPQIMEQSYGSAQFLQVASSFDGRCWFIVQREIASALSGINITAFTSSTLTAVASNFDTEIPTAITFTTTGSLPVSSPQIAVLTYYWAIGVTADTFKVYASQADALVDVNAFTFSSSGTNSKVVPWPLATIFTLEELSQDVHLDCAVLFGPLPESATTPTPGDTATTGALFNAQEVKMIGDGFGFDAIGISNQVVFEAHGDTVDVSRAYIGFPINLIIEPMPIATPPGSQTTLSKPTHIRSVRFMFNNTVGGTINGVPIALNTFNQANIGSPPIPSRGIFEMGLMSGWDDFNKPSFTIEHDEPFNIELIGVFYSLDT